MLGTSIIVSGLVVASSLAGFINQLIMAKLFGASASMDAYLIAVSIPMLASGTLVAVFNYSMVPVLIFHRATPDGYAHFTGLMLMCLTAASLVMLILGVCISPSLISFFGTGLPRQIQNQASIMMRVSWITAGFTVLTGFLVSVHNAAGRFVLPAAGNILPYIGMIIAGAVFGDTFGPAAFVYGMLVGTTLVIMLLSGSAFSDLTISLRNFSYWKEAAHYFLQIPLVLVSMLAFTVAQSIDAYWAPKLGSGNLAYLGYCQRFLVAFGGLMVAGPSVILAPRLAEMHVSGRHQDFLLQTGRILRTLMAFTVPSAVVISLLSKPIIELLFKRGAFDEKASQGVSSLLPYMMAGMIAMLCVVILFRALFAKREFSRAALIGASWVALYFVLSGILSKYAGIKGIGLAYALSWWLAFCGSALAVWKKDLTRLFSTGSVRFVRDLAVTTAAIGVAVLLSSGFWPGLSGTASFMNSLLGLCIPLGPAVLIFYWLSVRLFKMTDVKTVVDYLENRINSMLFPTSR